VRRLTAHLNEQNQQRAKREGTKAPPPKPPANKRTAKDLPPEIQQQLILINRVGGRGLPGGDNSNTQFATLALWVARRHGLPVDNALTLVDARFRNSQHADGGWGYTAMPRARGMGHSTATMTAAGVLALAVNLGAVNDPDKKAQRREPNNDPALKAGLQALGTTVGQPLARGKAVGRNRGELALGANAGRAYYFLWSLERVAVALNLKTIGNKDWYEWGAEVLIANQQADGSWHGDYTTGGVDTCFELCLRPDG
jgi:hypothetical protein